jgi:RNA polymerase-interacting CarD/CdnL/TRCF family regulator
MERRLYLGDLVTPVRVTPAFQEKHGFGVITQILTEELKNGNVTTYEVKFVKSLQTFRFGFDAVRRYGQD